MKKGLIGLLLLLIGLLGGVEAVRLGTSSPVYNQFASFATSSTMQVGDDSVSLLFPDSACNSRTITTLGGGLYLAFSSTTRGMLATDGNGVFQAASTTVSYEGKTYGCNAFFGKSTIASSSVNVFETR